MKGTKRLFAFIKYSLIGLVHGLFIIHQFFKIDELNLFTASERLSIDTIVFYLFLFILIPFIAFLLIYLPGLLILSLTISIPARMNWKRQESITFKDSTQHDQAPVINDFKFIVVLRC